MSGAVAEQVNAVEVRASARAESQSRVLKSIQQVKSRLDDEHKWRNETFDPWAEEVNGKIFGLQTEIKKLSSQSAESMSSEIEALGTQVSKLVDVAKRLAQQIEENGIKPLGTA